MKFQWNRFSREIILQYFPTIKPTTADSLLNTCLQDGHKTSSMNSLFHEIGPFQVSENLGTTMSQSYEKFAQTDKYGILFIGWQQKQALVVYSLNY